jgi:hypothetical protein
MQEAISKQEFMELAKNLHRIYDIYRFKINKNLTWSVQ